MDKEGKKNVSKLKCHILFDRLGRKTWYAKEGIGQLGLGAWKERKGLK